MRKFIRLDTASMVGALFLCVLLASITTHAMDKEDIPNIQVIQDVKKSTVRKLRERRHTYNAARQIKTMPLEVFFNPTRVKVSSTDKLSEQLVIEDDHLDLESLRPAKLKKLSSAELKQLLVFLAKIPSKISFRDHDGHQHIVKEKKCKGKDHSYNPSNSAAALTMKIGAFSFKPGVKVAPKLFASMVATLPEAILPAFHGQPAILLDIHVTADILAKMMKRLEQGNSTLTAQSASLLTELFIKPRAEKDVEQLTASLRELFEKTQKNIDKEPAKFREQKIGLMLGSILSGMMKYAQIIKDKDERGEWIMSSITNIVWAATSFIGMLSIASSVAAAAGGGISMAAVLASVIYGEVKVPRDFAPDIKEVEGQIELRILESAKSIDIEGKVDVLMLLSWMRAAIHVNGLGD